MKNELNVKKELSKLNAKYEKEKQQIIKRCKHRWKENGYTSDKYSGMQLYKCSICGSEKGESF